MRIGDDADQHETSLSPRARQRLQSLGQLVELPVSSQQRRLGPAGLLIAQRRQGRRLVQGRNRSIETKLLRLGRQPSRGKRLLKAAVLAQERGRTDGADACCTGYPIRRI